MAFDYTLDDQFERKRSFALSNGNTLYAERTDPYGFWKLHLDKGQLPERYLGLYTTWDAVIQDVERYETDRKLAAEEVTLAQAKQKKAS